MILAGVLIFALLVIVHEFGHFILARRNGVEVEEFGLGFPPKLYGRKIGNTEYTFNLIPLGGFVKLKGESDSDREPGSFGAVRLWAKTKILLAGVGMNVVAAIVMVFLLALTSLPQILPGQYRVAANETVTDQGVVISQVMEDSAAADAGLLVGDQVLSIGSTEIVTAEGLADATTAFAGEEVEIRIERGSQEIQLNAELAAEGADGQLGILPVEVSTSRYTWAAPLVAIGVTLQMIGMVFAALGNIVFSIFTGTGGDAAAQLTGPVGIVFLLQNLGSFGFEYLFFLLASISVSLAVFNVLPIPALDGGRLAVIMGARLLRKRLQPEVENAIHGIGFMALIGLFILITYVDVQRFF